MDNHNLIGTTIELTGGYDNSKTYWRLLSVSGDDGRWGLISKEEAGPNPRRVKGIPDARIAEITGGTGIIE
jgi:hypothetical protein